MISELLQIILIVVCIWGILGALLPLFAAPNMLIIRTRIQRTSRIKDVARSLKGRTKEQTLKNVFDYIIKTYKGKGERYKVVFLFYKIFYSNAEKLINARQFLHCHVQNHILITLLVNTGQFSERDFGRHLKLRSYLIIHQYLIVRLGKNKYIIDPFYKILEINKDKEN